MLSFRYLTYSRERVYPLAAPAEEEQTGRNDGERGVYWLHNTEELDCCFALERVPRREVSVSPSEAGYVAQRPIC